MGQVPFKHREALLIRLKHDVHRMHQRRGDWQQFMIVFMLEAETEDSEDLQLYQCTFPEALALVIRGASSEPTLNFFAGFDVTEATYLFPCRKEFLHIEKNS